KMLEKSLKNLKRLHLNPLQTLRWSFNKPSVKKNTTKMRANTFGFYAINGESVVDFKGDSKKESG
ncbi:MAG: hypothetical protein ACXQTX_05635, partial [Candidatus Syntropharchaeia archaeon]